MSQESVDAALSLIITKTDDVMVLHAIKLLIENGGRHAVAVLETEAAFRHHLQDCDLAELQRIASNPQPQHFAGGTIAEALQRIGGSGV